MPKIGVRWRSAISEMEGAASFRRGYPLEEEEKPESDTWRVLILPAGSTLFTALGSLIELFRCWVRGVAMEAHRWHPLKAPTLIPPWLPAPSAQAKIRIIHYILNRRGLFTALGKLAIVKFFPRAARLGNKIPDGRGDKEEREKRG